MNAYFGKDAFVNKYKTLSEEDRRKVWILLYPENGQEIYLQNFADWPDAVKYLKEKKIRLKNLGLKFRTHTVEYPVDGSEGVYISQTAKGSMGGKTIHCFSLGFVKDGIVHRTLYTSPDLTPDLQLEDNVEDVIQEALLIYDQETETVQ